MVFVNNGGLDGLGGLGGKGGSGCFLSQQQQEEEHHEFLARNRWDFKCHSAQFFVIIVYAGLLHYFAC